MGSAVLTNQSKWWLCCLVSLFQLLDSLYLEHPAVPLQTTMTTLEITMIQPETFQMITMILQEITLALEIIMILLGTTLALEITMMLLETTLALEITMIPLETFQEIIMIQQETTLALLITMILLETI